MRPLCLQNRLLDDSTYPAIVIAAVAHVQSDLPIVGAMSVRSAERWGVAKSGIDVGVGESGAPSRLLHTAMSNMARHGIFAVIGQLGVKPAVQRRHKGWACCGVAQLCAVLEIGVGNADLP